MFESLPQYVMAIVEREGNKRTFPLKTINNNTP
jgi:hypothetical protein